MASGHPPPQEEEACQHRRAEVYAVLSFPHTGEAREGESLRSPQAGETWAGDRSLPRLRGRDGEGVSLPARPLTAAQQAASDARRRTAH